MATKDSGIRVIALDDRHSIPIGIRNATIEPVESFQELSACVSFIEQQAKENKVNFVIISTIIEENVLQTFESLIPVEAILILTTADVNVDLLPSKVIDVYDQAEVLVRALIDVLEKVEQLINGRSFLFNHDADGSDNLPFYMYNLWKKQTRNSQSSKNALLDEARNLYRTNTMIKIHIQNFETSYKPNNVLIWLDRQRYPFPYYLLVAHALRSHNQESLSLTRFFINDFGKLMKPAPSGSTYKQLYLGTKLPINLVEQLEQRSKTDVIAFQSFLRVTQSRANALTEATRPMRRSDMMNVLFKIDLNNALCINSGETIIVDMATPFQILCVTKSTGATNNQQILTIIKLIALSKTDRDKLFAEFIKKQEKSGNTKENSLQKMGSSVNDDEALADEHVTRGEWSQAAQVFARIKNPNARVLNKYGRLLREHLHKLPEALECHQNALAQSTGQEHFETLMDLGLVYNGMKKNEDGLKCFSQALEWFEKAEEKNPGMIACCLVGLGNAQWGLKNLDEALRTMERALHIRENEVKPKNDIDIAACISNMSSIFYDQHDMERSLSYGIRTVEILSKCAKGDRRYAAALNNLGAIHQTNGDLTKAREYFECALKSLPDPNHPFAKSISNNIAMIDARNKSEK